jgi:hypothetical protein
MESNGIERAFLGLAAFGAVIFFGLIGYVLLAH